jgi:hypothetical protein
MSRDGPSTSQCNDGHGIVFVVEGRTTVSVAIIRCYTVLLYGVFEWGMKALQIVIGYHTSLLSAMMVMALFLCQHHHPHYWLRYRCLLALTILPTKSSILLLTFLLDTPFVV